MLEGKMERLQVLLTWKTYKNVLRDNINVDEIGSTTNSPAHHEGRDKQKYGSKF
ncbi:hypothetical protein BVRB_018430 isoform B, partial [Beta vulgaris subsp. vulgaris]